MLVLFAPTVAGSKRTDRLEGVGKQHLHRYPAELDFRYNHRPSIIWRSRGQRKLTMLAAQKVNDLITKLSGAVCDRCICKRMGFKSHAHSAQLPIFGATKAHVIAATKNEWSSGELRVCQI
jgi:hypothetical protein